jgi:hypothetical protein
MTTMEAIYKPHTISWMLHADRYKTVAIYWLEPTAHLITRDVAMIEKSDDPCQAWLDQLEIIHEATYADSWAA